jgi:hypothetical protein
MLLDLAVKLSCLPCPVRPAQLYSLAALDKALAPGTNIALPNCQNC